VSVASGRRASDREPIYERVAVLEHRAAHADGELERARDRLHSIEAERSAIARLADELGRHVAELARVRDELRAEFESVSARAIAAALDSWEAEQRERGAYRRGGWALLFQAAAFLFGCVATAALLLGLRGR